MEIITGGMEGTRPPRFWSRGRIHKCPHFWAKYLHYMVFLSCLLKNFLARYARSTAFYKVSVLEIRNLGMQHYF